jgi:UDP-glucose 4-epimerase
VYNVGNADEISINELARQVVDMTGSLSDVVHIPYDIAYEDGFEDMERRVPDTTRIRSLTGWEPTRSLREAIADVIAYERRHMAIP